MKTKRIAMGFALWFAVGSPLAVGAELRLPIALEPPGAGFASLALYDADGVLTRSLLSAEPVENGSRQIEWDGTTDLGVPAKAGTYTARGVSFTESPRAEYVMIVGKSGNPSWRTADGKGDWGGNIGFPSSIVSNSQSLVMSYAAVEDNQITGIQQMDAEGGIEKRYFSFYGWDTRMAAAMDQTNLYLGILNTETKRIENAEYKLGEPRGKILLPLPTVPHEEDTETRWRGRFAAWLDGLAVTKDTLFATIAADDALFIIDRATGAIRQQISLPAPHGIAVAGDRLFVVSGEKLLRLTLDGKTEATIIDAGVLKAPAPLVLDRGGNLYVGDGGSETGKGPHLRNAGSQQVVVFSPAGKELCRIGKGGGTPREGRFDENGYHHLGVS